MSTTYTVLAVCTGNICRSPAMERLLAQLLEDDPSVRVISAGTFAHTGEDMQGAMKERISSYGAETEGFSAEQVTPEMVRASDLILTATRVHVQDLLAEVPDAAARTFTLREFARILAGLANTGAESQNLAQKLQELAELADQRRGEAAGEEDDIVDPYMLPDDVYDESFQQISEPIEAIAHALGLGTDRP